MPQISLNELQQAFGTYKMPLYQRLEPRCRNDDFSRGLEARWADPLWALARQKQMAEFKGEDTGSPIRVSVASNTHVLSHVKLGPGPSEALAGDGPPLEAVVEHQHIHIDEINANWRMRVQIGQQFERLLVADVPLSEDAIRIICRLRQRYKVEALGDDDRKEIDGGYLMRS